MNDKLPCTVDDILTCQKVLQTLESHHLKLLSDDFVEAGIKLFSRTIRKRLYDENGDLVDYIKNQTNQTKVLKKLERIHNEIHLIHANNGNSIPLMLILLIILLIILIILILIS